MPTFYWVGKGCPKDGTPTTSHLWGTSEYDWNTPNNWIVAHSVHYNYLDPKDAGLSGPNSTSMYAKLSTITEVYGVPNRCPGPGDTVYVGHYPWLKNYTNTSQSGNPEFYSGGDRAQVDVPVVAANTNFNNSQLWGLSNGLVESLSSPLSSNLARPSVLQVLYRPINQTNGKVVPLTVPTAMYGTSTDIKYKKFYATNTTSLTNFGKVYTNYAEWWDGPSTWVNPNQQPSEILSETTKIKSSIDFLMNNRNRYRTRQTLSFATLPEFVNLPSQASAPLLWGGCVAGTTGITSAYGISGGSGNTFWPNAGAGGIDFIASRYQGLDKLNIIVYSDTVLGRKNYIAVGSGMSGGTGTFSSTYINSAVFYDPYPFKSVGDGLFGEESVRVIDGLKEPICAGPTGGFSTTYAGSGCYNCNIGLTAASWTTRQNTLAYMIAGGLTAVGYRGNGVFVKTSEVYVRTPMEYNKYAGNNASGSFSYNESYPPYSSRFNTNEYGETWARSLVVGTDHTVVGPNADRSNGIWSDAGKNNSDKYVEIRLADFIDWTNSATGATTGSEYLRTLVFADMRFGQFNMTYGKVQEMNLGVPNAAILNEYGEGIGQFLGGEMMTDPTNPIVEFENQSTPFRLYAFYPLNNLELGEKTSYTSATKYSQGQNPANPFIPQNGVFFVGGKTPSEATSRINILNSLGVSTTVNPMTQVGVSRIFLSSLDTVEYMGMTITGSNPSAIDYRKYMGDIYVTHGYPYVWPNRYGEWDGSTEFSGKFAYGSSLTGTNYYAPFIEMKSFSKPMSSTGGIQTTTQSYKTAFFTPILNSSIADLSLDNTDLLFISPDRILGEDESKYGNKTIDRAMLKNSVSINFTEDDGGYLRFGRVLNAGSTGGTGAVYGGLVFNNEENQIILPPEGARFWVSRIDGGVLDVRQPTMDNTYVASYSNDGELALNGNFPSVLDPSGLPQSTGRRTDEYVQADLTRGRKNILGTEFGSFDDNPIEAQA